MKTIGGTFRHWTIRRSNAQVPTVGSPDPAAMRQGGFSEAAPLGRSSLSFRSKGAAADPGACDFWPGPIGAADRRPSVTTATAR